MTIIDDCQIGFTNRVIGVPDWILAQILIHEHLAVTRELDAGKIYVQWGMESFDNRWWRIVKDGRKTENSQR